MRPALIRTLLALTVMVAGSGACSTGNGVPSELDDIEAQAEDIIDVVPLGRWEDVAVDVEKIREQWDRYADRVPVVVDAAAVTALDSSLLDLEAAAGASQPHETMQANDLSSALIGILAVYDHDRPIAIARLDVIGRQIVLDANGQDAAAARGQVDLARSTWDELRDEVLAHDGDEVAVATEQSLGLMDTALDADDAAALTAQAAIFLELVDDMERLY